DALKSVDYAKSAFELEKTNNKEIQKARALNRLANGYYFLEQYKLALEYYVKSLELSENNNYDVGISKACNNIGLIYEVLGDYDMAIDYYHRSLEIETRVKNQKGIATTSLNLGNIYYYLNNFDKALGLYYKCIEIYTLLNDLRGILDTYNNIGSTYSELNQLDSSLKYYEKSLELTNEIEIPDLKSTTLNNLGTVYFDKKEYSKALEYFNSALKIEVGQENLGSEANTIRNIGGVYLMLKKENQAINYFLRAAEIAESIGAKQLLMDTYFDISNYYEGENDFRKTFEYFHLASDLKDSIYNETSSQQIAEIETRYNFRNKDQQLKIITQDNELKIQKIKTQRYIIYAVASIGLFILALFLVFYMRSRINKKARIILEAKNKKITEQKILLEKALSELKESDEKHVSLIENIQDGIFVIQNEKIRFANDSFSKISGYSLDELHDLDYKELIHPDDLERVASNYQKRLAGEDVLSSYEFKMINQKGETAHISISVGIINFLGKPAHIGTIKDITEQKTYEIQLIKEKEKAEKATKSKSLFLAGISHEIRNHMSSIIGITEVLSETKLTAEQKDYVGIINTSGNTLLNIINDILDFSKIEAGQIILEEKEFNIRALINDVITMHDVMAQQKKLYITSETENNIPEIIRGDSTRLSQVLVNLVNNALKFTDKGGITIKVSHETLNHLNKKKNLTSCIINFEVIDTGIGIAESSQNKLFKPFSQTHSAVQRKQGGTGLGLAICKQLVELMNGEIGISSEVNKGANFWFNVRMQIPSSIDQSEQTKKSKKTPNKKQLKVLIVEDNILNQQLTTNILVKNGFIADVAENGKVGLDLFKNNNYDVVLMDIQMPVMDGIQATRLIREYEAYNDHTKSKIIAVTAHARDGEQQKLFDAGIDQYLSKPFKSADLISILENLNDA
ncbi:MAG: tetratricopeptide repeat protein, partial [Bacteroidales bacterium]|nr:tetratricopeptide repeat protein [Bacteroidales bacterium]